MLRLLDLSLSKVVKSCRTEPNLKKGPGDHGGKMVDLHDLLDMCGILVLTCPSIEENIKRLLFFWLEHLIFQI